MNHAKEVNRVGFLHGTRGELSSPVRARNADPQQTPAGTHFNVTEHPTAEWTARQLLEACALEEGPRYLIRDRDQVYGERFSLSGQSVGHPGDGLTIVGLGVVQLLDVRTPAVPRLGMTTGCTLPLYISITVIPMTSGFSGAAASAFAAFALAIAVLMLAMTLLIAAARQQLIEALQHAAIHIKRAGGLVLIVAGLHLLYYYLRIGM